MLDALQPGILEEIIYRFAFLGLLWLALRKPLPNQAVWLSGLLALLVHNTYLALRHGLESAIAFHWIQDVARFLAGY